MRKLKLLLAAAIFGTGQMWAQTDVTSTYLTNADFSQGTVYTDKVYGYGHDGTPWGFQEVEGWTINVVDGDDDNGHPNSAMAGAIFSYGTTTGMLQGGGKTPPTQGPTDNEGNCLGLVAVWGKGGYYYQEVTFPAGEYTINIPVYNQQGTKETTTYFGFIPNSGTSQTIATPTTTGAWVTLTKTFSLAEETAGRICLGYKSKGSGSADNPHLFIDKVQILYTAIVVKDVLANALTAATNANATLNNSDLASAIATAQAVYDKADATQDEVNSAAATLNAATELAMSAVGDVTGVFLANPGFESCTAETSDVAAITQKDYSSAGWTNASAGKFTTIVVTAYGGGVKVANSTTPSTKKDGTTVSGNTLGIIAGWGDNVTIQSNDVTLPAGVYTLTVDHYLTSTTSNYGDNSSKFGFVTSGSSYLVSSTKFSEATWTTETITFTLTESTTGKIQIGLTGLNKSGSGSPAVFYDDITITYKSFLAGAKEAWDEAVAAANQAKTDCPNVTGEELTALNAELAKAEPTTVDGYNEATEALEEATTTLTAAKAAYDVYAEIKGVAETLGIDTGDAPANAAAAPAATHALNVAVYNYTTADNIFDVTDVYNPSWTSMSTSSGQHWSGDTSLSYADNWSGSAGTTTRTATITLPAGKFILMSAGRGSSNTVTTMEANGTTVTFASNGDTGIGIDTSGAANFDASGTYANNNVGRGWEWRYIPVELSAETEITVTQTLTRLSGNAWGSFSDFTILKEGVVATAADYTTLNSAITEAEDKTLGFEDDEYAPYNNVAALQALASAKAIDQEATNDQETVQAVTANLSSAVWTANEGAVDIIYNGNFAEANGTNPKGWTRSNGAWGQQITELTAEDNGVNEGTTTGWYYNTEGAWEYGKDDTYKMPLAASQTYKLSFKYRSHANGSNNYMKASVLNSSSEGLAEVTFAKNSDATKFVTATAYFTTVAAGNYILSLTQSGNTHLTDVSIERVASTALALNEEVTYAPENRTFYEAVNLTRTIKADYWNTFVVPFDISNDELKDAFGNDVAVAEYSEEAEGENSTVNFNSMETPAITANVPVLLKAAAGTSFSFTGKLIKTGEAKVAGTNFDFVGTYEASTTIAEGDYFIGSNNLYKSNGTTTISGTRAYIKANTAEARIVNFYLDGEDTTGIMNIDGTITTGKVYNMQGQQVKNAKNGIFIQNGKKVVIK